MGRRPLHFACLIRNLASVYFAIEAGAEIDPRDSDGYTPLLTAFRERTSGEDALGIVDLLLARGADINATTNDGKTVLHLAERFYNQQLLKDLVERGARLSFPDEISANAKNATAAFLLYAIKENRQNMAGFLATTLSPPEILTRNEAGETALHLAVTRNNDSLVKTLLECGFDPNTPRNDGATPLHLAIRNFNKDLVPYLLQAGARPDITDDKGETALTCADKLGDGSLYALLINFSQREPAVTNVMATADTSEISLLHAIKNNHRLTIERLLKSFPNTKERDEKGNTPLHLSISRYSRKWATALIKAGADPAAADDEGKTPFHIAASEGNLFLTRLFLDYGAPVDVADKRGCTPLYLAVNGKNLPLLELLLQRGANINKGDNRGRTPLFQAVGIDPYLITFSWLVKHGASLSAVDHNGRTVLHELMTSRPTKASVARLLRLGLDPLHIDNRGESPLSMGLKWGSPEIADYMFAQKPDFSALAGKGASITHSWARNGNIELLSRALANGADPNLIDRQGEPLLFAAIEVANASMAELLIKAGAEIECNSASGVTILEKAARQSVSEVIRLLLDAGADPNRMGSENLSPLWLAVGRWDVFALFLEHGARPDFALLNDKKMEQTRKIFLETPEGVAALRLIANKGFDLRLLVFPGTTPEEQYKQVFTWARSGLVDSIKLALDLGFAVNTADQKGYTLLHWAAGYGRADLTSKLIEWGAPLEAMSKTSETPLTFAIDSNYQAAVGILIDAGAATTALAKRPGSSPLHEAAYADVSPEILDRLINQGYTINIPDSAGGTPLLWAAERSSVKAASHLLELGADPNIATAVASSSSTDKNFSRDMHNIYACNVHTLQWRISGVTPVARAVVKKSLALTKMLLEHGARIDIADDLGNTPLHLAFMADMPDLAELMLAYNPQVLAKNRAGKTPLELADEKGFTDTAFELWKTIPVSLKHDPNETAQAASTSFPLHDAVRHGELTGLRWLIRQGKRVDGFDEEKHTALWVAIDQGRKNAVKILLQHEASPDYSLRDTDYPWFHAVKAGNAEIVEIIASAGIDINFADKSGDTALHIAARALSIAIIELLQSLKASPGVCNNFGRTPLMEAIVQNESRLEQIRTARLLEIKTKMLEIHRRAKKNKRVHPLKRMQKIDARSYRTRAIEALAVKDLSIMTADIYGQTALHLAARNSDGEIIKLLAGVGSDLEARDRNGRTPIFNAVISDNQEALTALVKLGAALNVVDSRGETLLSLTDTFNRVELRQFLLEAGALAEFIVPQWPENSSQLKSGIIRAAGENRSGAVCYLLDQGVAIDETDAAGDTALFHAVRTCNPSMVELLLTRGADRIRLNGSGQKALDLAGVLAKKMVASRYGRTQ